MPPAISCSGALNNGPWVSLPELPAGSTGYNDTGLTPNTSYAYQVEAVDSAGASAFSNTASSTTPVPPTTPNNAHTTLISTTEIDLAWTNTATNATYIRILRSNIGGEFVVIVDHLSPTTNAYNDTGLNARNRVRLSHPGVQHRGLQRLCRHPYRHHRQPRRPGLRPRGGAGQST